MTAPLPDPGQPAAAAALLADAPGPGPVRLDDAALRLLADPLRARVLELLAVEALCTSHLVALTGAGQTNISNHLRALREAGLVTTEPCGRFTYYLLVPGALAAVASGVTALAEAARSAQHRRRACP